MTAKLQFDEDGKILSILLNDKMTIPVENSQEHFDYIRCNSQFVTDILEVIGKHNLFPVAVG